MRDSGTPAPAQNRRFQLLFVFPATCAQRFSNSVNQRHGRWKHGKLQVSTLAIYVPRQFHGHMYYETRILLRLLRVQLFHLTPRA